MRYCEQRNVSIVVMDRVIEIHEQHRPDHVRFDFSKTDLCLQALQDCISVG